MALNRFQHHHDRPIVGFDDFFWPKPMVLEDPLMDLLMPVIPNLDREANSILRVTSPGYEIHEVDGQYQICVDVPGVKAEDMKVNVEHEGKVLHISGGRKVVKDGSTSEMKFEKRFTIGKNIDIDKMTANLSHGVLKLTAPVKQEEAKPVHTIAITEGPAETDEKKE
jgi:HSP20 family protein